MVQRPKIKKSKTYDRKILLAKLKEHRLDADQMAQLYSTSAMQTKGLKKFLADTKGTSETLTNSLPEINQVTQVRWRRKRKQRLQDLVSKVSSSSSEDTEDISSDESESKSPKYEPIVEEKQLITETKIIESVQPNELESARIVEIKPKLPAIHVPVVRSPDIEKQRSMLPIIGEEQSIMEKINENDVVILSGETGSGKTTQIPQFLYEAGYALNDKIIGVTEPRRVAAISMSERVANEMNLTNEEVSYQIRFSGNVSNKTRIKFMTDGVLLRECQKDFLLTKYSVLIIDEAHERSVFSDILIGLLSRVVILRSKRDNPLKLVIMSATLRVSDFTESSYLFKVPPPLINIDTRQYKVNTYFAKSTPENYLIAAYKKVSFVHTKLPRGGILVFVTSQADVKELCRKLKEKFGKTSKDQLYCLGLYAMLPIEKQRLVFKEPPLGKRLCVIATNVAETSITIPNIKYVIDTGLEKTKVYDMTTGVSKFLTTWTSKSSAEQRKGRAGRMGEGHCYRLYSSAVFENQFPDFSEPQILRKPVDDILLQMKCMHIDNVVNFPFPTKPSDEALKAAERKLILLGALDDLKSKDASHEYVHKTQYSSRPTKLGKLMSKFPLSPRYAKMIVQSTKQVLPHVITLVSALTVREIFLNNPNTRTTKKKWAGNGQSKLLGDFMVMLRAVYAAESFQNNNSMCLEANLRTKAMIEISQLRKQLVHDFNTNKKSLYTINTEKQLKKPNKEKCQILRRLLLAAFPDHIAKRIPDGETTKRSKEDPNVIEKKRLRNAYECKDHNGPVYISSESVLKGQHHDYLIYKELYQGNDKMYMRDVAVIEASWVDEIG